MITLDETQMHNERKKPCLRKVYYGHYDYEARNPHPLIRLRGKYLRHFGFEIGDSIQVQLEEGRIIISKHNESDIDKKAGDP